MFFVSLSSDKFVGKMSWLALIIPVLIEIVFPLFVLYKVFTNLNVVKYYAKFVVFSISVTLVPIIMMPYFLLHPRNVLNFM